MEKEIEGYVFPDQVRNFTESLTETITFWRRGNPLRGIKPVHVILSPVQSQDSAKEPDWQETTEQSFETTMALLDTLSAVTKELQKIQGHARKVDMALTEILAKHTPQGEVKKEGK